VSDALPLGEHKRCIYECVRESVYYGMPKRELCRAFGRVRARSRRCVWHAGGAQGCPWHVLSRWRAPQESGMRV